MKLGKFEVTFHYSMLLLAGILIYQSVSLLANPLIGFAVGCFVTFIVYSIVLLHEMAHLQAAQMLGLTASKKITLWGLGGAAQIEGLTMMTPKEEVIISIAGPLANLALAAGTFVLAALFGVSVLDVSNLTTPFLPLFIMYFFWYNVLLGVFNMIPAFPMDGGRVARAGLSIFMSRLKATKIAVYTSWVFAGLFIVGGLYLKSLMIPLVGAYLAYVSYMILKAEREGLRIQYK